MVNEQSTLPEEIVVTGHRREEVPTELLAIATFDASAIEASGATSISELLRSIRGVTQSADGQDPIFLLNAQRVSGYSEISSLPPEAIEKVEVLPEPVALRFGFPPTRRVVNFITKRHFRQFALKPATGTSTQGGAGTVSAHADVTRLRGDGRMTLSFDARHTDALRQSSRRVLPDPDVPFDAIGNVTAPNGGEIDPALSSIAGQVVTIAPVPAGDATLLAFAAGANRPRLFDLSPLRTLAPANDTVHAEAVIANRIAGSVAGSLTLTADHSRDATIFGPASATLVVPAGTPFSPFASDVLLQRYLVEATPLRQRTITTTLHAGGVLRGAWRGWQWDLTGALDMQRRTGIAETTIDLAATNAAIAGGADPFRPLPSTLVASRLVDRTVQTARGADAKLVASNQPLRLPAGRATLTATAEVERTSSDGRTTGATRYSVAFSRTRVESQVAIDLPIASRKEGVLPWIGDLSANGSVALRDVGGFGTLSDTTAGLTWGPSDGIQVVGQLKWSAVAPTLDQLANPLISAPQVSLFDFASGRTTLVTVVAGGNPALAAEHRFVRSLALTVKPFATSQLRIGISYQATSIENGIQTIYAVTPATVFAFPDLFVSGRSGALETVYFRPVNILLERQHALNVTLNANGQFGRATPAPAPGSQPSPRAIFYGGLGPRILVEDRLTLRSRTPALDLLAGDTLSGGITPRLSGYGYGGIGYRGNDAAFDFYCTGGATVHGSTAASTLSFGPICKINLNGSLNIHRIFPGAQWTRRLSLKLEIANVTDARPRVRNAVGATPYRFQRDLLDPIGRSITLSVRKRL